MLKWTTAWHTRCTELIEVDVISLYAADALSFTVLQTASVPSADTLPACIMGADPCMNVQLCTPESPRQAARSWTVRWKRKMSVDRFNQHAAVI